jgi:CO/xanthine dehydrogenase FAD-binding subunit
MASAACQIQTHEDGRIHRISFGVGGVDGTPLAFPELATSLVGQTLNAEKAKQVSHEAVQSSQPGSDMHATAAYRKHLAEVLLSRALTTAYAEACGPIQAPHIS